MKIGILLNGVRLGQSLANADPLNGRSLEQAVLLSLFTDRRLEDSEDSIDNYRGGWWGDVRPRITNDKIGSLLWTLRRAKATQETANRAQEQASLALFWLIEDGEAKSVDVRTSIVERDILLLEIDIVLSSP